MTQYRRLGVQWFNSMNCELAQEIASSERDASDKLRAMVIGQEIHAGDYFRVTDLGATGSFAD